MYKNSLINNIISENNNELLIKGEHFEKFLSKEKGATLIVIKDIISDNCLFLNDVIKKATKNSFTVCYAYKVAPTMEILEVIKERGMGIEIYSLTELEMALSIGVSTIVVDGMYKTDELLTKSIQNNVTIINADSIKEIIRINEIAEKYNIIQDIGIRVKKREDSKMGISVEQIEQFLTTLKSFHNVRVIGVHIHPGSNASEEVVINSYLKMFNMFKLLRNAGFLIKYVDFGGGLPERNIVEKSLLKRISEYIDAFEKHEDIHYIFEPGRFIVGDAGIIFSRVLDKRVDENLIILNIAVMPYFSNTKSTFRYMFPSQIKYEPKGSWRICGLWPLDQDEISSEALYQGVPKELEEGDCFCILNAGAYNIDRIEEYTLTGDMEIKYI